MSPDLYWNLFAIYTTGLIIETIYTMCDKIGKAYIFLEKLTALDWLELTFMPMIWPVSPLHKLFATITDAKQVLALLEDSEYTEEGDDEVWATT